MNKSIKDKVRDALDESGSESQEKDSNETAARREFLTVFKLEEELRLQTIQANSHLAAALKFQAKVEKLEKLCAELVDGLGDFPLPSEHASPNENYLRILIWYDLRGRPALTKAKAGAG